MMLTLKISKTWLHALLLSLMLVLPNVAVSQSSTIADPSSSLKLSVEKLLSEFSANREALEKDKTKLHDFAESILVQTWDFSKMSQLVLGKNWRKITADQQQRFSSAFQDLLIRTYANAMFKYTGNESIEFDPAVYKGKGNKRAVVSARGSLGEGSSDIPLSFSVFLDKQDNWRIYNVAISGISLVLTYRTSYTQIISSKGIEHLIASLNAKKNA